MRFNIQLLAAGLFGVSMAAPSAHAINVQSDQSANIGLVLSVNGGLCSFQASTSPNFRSPSSMIANISVLPTVQHSAELSWHCIVDCGTILEGAVCIEQAVTKLDLLALGTCVLDDFNTVRDHSNPSPLIFFNSTLWLTCLELQVCACVDCNFIPGLASFAKKEGFCS